MKRILIAFSCLFAISFTASAQPSEGLSFGAGLRASLPIGDFADGYSFGIGAELQAEYGFSSNLSGVFTTGYSSFFGKEVDLGGGITYKPDAVGYIPLLAGIRYYAAETFFIGGQVGYGLLTGGGSSSGAFNYQPQIGYNAGSFQLTLNYNALSKNSSTSSHIGLGAIYKFGGN
ncbi:MAG: hypothetical protein NVV59_09890 [Chitinophagaceae bacterium]|nr:hypothetical protein [Chitinophagaceae bacterium]